MIIYVLVGVGSLAALAMLVLSFTTGGKDNLTARLDLLNNGDAGPDMEEQNAKKNAAVERLRALGKQAMGSGKDGQDSAETSILRSRLRHAGIYSQGAAEVYIAVRLMGVLLPAVLGTALYFALPAFGSYVLFGTAVLAALGFIGPSMWLDNRKKDRQSQLRRGLPDAMDVIVICMEGGLALPAALNRVANELKVAHPTLANELTICQKEIQLGKTTGTALRDLSVRTDMEEIRSLAGVVAQAEKYGASLAHALKIHGDTLRVQRMQKAEEKAAQASTKIMFPTLLFIFPAIFLVILGPAVIKILEMFANMGM